MKVLITGANGFLGSHVADRLAAAGHDLRLLLRRTSRTDFIDGLAFQRAEGDIRDPASLEAAVEGVDGVVHCAGLTTALSEREYRQVNEEGTRSLVEAAARAGVNRFVYISSLAAQGPSPDGAFYDPMEVEPSPRSPYGKSKLAGERQVLARAGDMTVVSLRCPVIYGPRDRALLPLYRLVRFRIMPLYGDGQHQISWVYVKDAASAIACCLEGEVQSGSIYTISDGGRHTWRKLAMMAGEVLGRKPLMVPVPGSLYAVAGLAGSAASAVIRRALPLNRHRVREFAQQYWVCGHERITRELGWEPAYLPDAGLRETLAWYRERRWL
ncbi:MAG TPA: NAD(P)-dependent oxidoreductase [Dehalococcoidia bacterium]|nr:NAD(P)-dependent oxidoreductase [Dehalococcoidia bacterium]